MAKEFKFVRARRLRKEMTDTERFVWAKLRGRRFAGYKFRRQHPIAGYIVDFVCLERHFILELDGGQHAERQEYDEKRTAILKKEGYRLMRFWNHEVLQDWDVIEEVIWNFLRGLPLTPDPSPPRGEGRKAMAP